MHDDTRSLTVLFEIGRRQDDPVSRKKIRRLQLINIGAQKQLARREHEKLTVAYADVSAASDDVLSPPQPAQSRI